MGFDISQAIEDNLKAEQGDQTAQEPERTPRQRNAGRAQRNSSGAQERRRSGQQAATGKTPRKGQQKPDQDGEREAGSKGKDRNPRQQASAGRSNPRQAPAQRNNRRTQTGKPALPPDRDPEVFLDDDIDNFGNSVDYVSPYKDKPGIASGNRRQRTPSERRPRAAQSNRSNQSGSRNGQSGRNNQRRQQNPDLFVKADPTPAYIAAKREREQAGNAPLIIRKGERLPSLEQLEQLENSRTSKKERPALLGLRD